MVKLSNFIGFRHTSITRNTWTRFLKHPKQQRLVDDYDKICHAKPKNEDPESFSPKKDHSSKTCKQSSSPSLDNFFALDSQPDESDPSLSSFPDSENVASNHHNPSEYETSDVETSETNDFTLN